MTTTSIETTLYTYKRAGHSTNGNPRWELTTRDGTFRTQSDAACSYDVDNVGRKIPMDADGRSLGLPITLTITPSGRVVGLAISHLPR
jgi:hypothetical protein